MKKLLVLLSVSLIFVSAFPLLGVLSSVDRVGYLPMLFKNWPPSGELIISEVLYDPAAAEPEGEWVEFYNPGIRRTDLSSYKFGDAEFIGKEEGMFSFPPGTYLEPGETVVVAHHAVVFYQGYGVNPDFEIRETDPLVPNMVKYTAWAGGDVAFSNTGDEVLVLNDRDEIVDAISYGSSSYFFDPPVSKVPDGYSLERRPVYQDTDSALDWYPQSLPNPWLYDDTPPTETPVPGTPTMTLPTLQRLLVSEVLYDAPGEEPANEWIEIYNPDPYEASLAGYKIGDEETRGGSEGMLAFPEAACIEAGGVLVIANQAAAFQLHYGFWPDYEISDTSPQVPELVPYPDWGGKSLSLSNEGDEVLILDPLDNPADAISWGSSTWAFDPPALDVGEGHSLERDPADQDTDTAGDWVDQEQPTPGMVSLPLPTTTATVTPTETLTPSVTVTQSPTGTLTSTATRTGTPTATRTGTVTVTQPLTATGTSTPTGTPTPTMTVTRTGTPTVTRTGTVTVTQSLTATGTSTLTGTPTLTMTATPTATGTLTSTASTTPSQTRTITPTPSSTATPTGTHTSTPTSTATDTPTASPEPTPETGRLLISEVFYDPVGAEPDEEWIELYNGGGSPVDLSGYKLGDEETQGGNEGMARFPDGSWLVSGGVIVIANNGTAFQAATGNWPDYEFHDSDPGIPDMMAYPGWAAGNVYLANSGDEVLLLDADDIPVESLSWGESAWAFDPPAMDVSQGHSLERRPVYQDTDSAIDWQDQPVPAPGVVDPPSITVTPTLTEIPTATGSPTITGTPTATVTQTTTTTTTGTPTMTATQLPTPGPGTFLISEVLYDPLSAEPAGEWIELYNKAGAVDISGCKLGDEETPGEGEGMYMFPEGSTAEAGAIILVANQAGAFETDFGFKPDYELVESDETVPNLVKYAAWATGNIGLSNTGDEVLLMDQEDALVDALSWGSSTWAFDPAAPDVAAGHSLERVPAEVDTDTAADWVDQASPDPGSVSPGETFLTWLWTWLSALFSR